MALDHTAERGASAAESSWWRDGVLYQIYPRSFADSDGDGIGDLRGITQRLDHLEWLGIDGIWLNPTFPSPNDDWGYDVADYKGVHPDLGTLEDLDELIAEAGRRGIRVLLDLVPNHTSDRHAWFQDALGGRDARYRDFYVWADPVSGGGPPNNWLSNFGGSAWTLDEASGQYYLNQFLPSQPDLNWWNEELREAIDDVLEFWFARGIAGFRIDVCHAIVKDRELRDDPEPGPDDHPQIVKRGLKQVYSMNRPELHDVLKRWRALTARHPEQPVLVGETYVLDLEQLIPFYGLGEDELHLAFNFLFFHCDLDAAQMRPIVEGMEAMLPSGAWPVWTGSNHDGKRLATRWAGGDPARTRAALLMLLGLRGTPFLYYGDEIGLPDTPLDPADALDPVAARLGDPEENRDVCRTPMPWEDTPGGGFTGGETAPWLPFGDLAAHNVAAQREDPGSVLHLVRDLIALRRSREDLRAGAYETLDAPGGAWAWRRGSGTAVAVNLSDAPASIELSGSILVGTDRGRDGEAVSGALRLAPWEGAVLELG
jgi:alpha-glucosidase